jgi:hypothetical protein
MSASAKVIPFRRPAPEPEVEDGPKRKIGSLRTEFTNAVAAAVEENAESADAERYYHCVQWSTADLKTLSARNQAPVTFNRFARKINVCVGILEKLKQDPKAYPRTPAKPSQDGAELSTSVLQYALGWEWSDLQTDVARRCCIRGISGSEINLTEGDQGDPEIEWTRVDQRDFFFDRRSSRHDFSDCLFMGTSRWTDVWQAADTFPDYEEELLDYVENGPASDYERGDERSRLSWINKPQQMVRIVDHWFKRGKVWYYVIYCGETALEWGESPFLDEKGRSTHKFEMLSFEVDQDNDRYGPFRNLKSPQDEINQRRAKALHALNSRRVIADDGAVDDVEVARRELARNDGWVVKNPGKELITEDQVKQQAMQGHIDFLAEAKAEIDTYGPNPALIGTEVNADSGRAIAMLQAAGIAEMGPFVAVWRHWKLRVYRKTWNTVQRFWTSERMIRVSDDEKLAEFVKVNGWERDEHGFPVAINQLAALDVDIIVDEGGDAITSMADTYEMLQMMVKNGQQVDPEIMVEMSGLPSSIKDRLIQKFQKAGQDPMQAQAIQMKLQQIMGQIEELKSKTALNYANAQKAITEANTPPEGPQQQIDTPADLAKAALDVAKAREIQHKIAVGTHVPEAKADPWDQPGLFELNQAKVRREHAGAAQAELTALKTGLEAKTIAEAPPGMTAKPPPRPPGGGGSPARR